MVNHSALRSQNKYLMKGLNAKKIKIWMTAFDKASIGQMVRSYHRHFIADKNSDPNNLFRRAANYEEIRNKSNCWTKKNRIVHNEVYDDSPKRNLKLYLPQIDQDRFRVGSKENSDNYSKQGKSNIN